MSELVGPNRMRLQAIAQRYGVSLSTLRRWRRDGLTDPSGNRVRLPAVKALGAWWADPADVRKFIELLNRQPEPVAA
jgi:hypothetical protein